MIHLFLIVVLVIDVVLSLGGGFYYRNYAAGVGVGLGVLAAVLNILALLAVLGALHA